MGWEHRSATVQIGNIAFGTSPFGTYPAPFATRKWPWKARVIGAYGFDSARDALALAVGQGWPVRLVYIHDQGYERICTGVAYRVGDPFTAENAPFYNDLTVEWELNSLWTERNPVNTQRRAGQVPLARSGQVSPSLRSGSSFSVAITGNTFSVPTSMVDASAIGPGGMPNQPDTAPILTLTGPFGGSTGFTIVNGTDRFGCAITYTAPLSAGQQLVIDCGAWSATLTQGGASFDVSNFIIVAATQPYMFAITPAVANGITLFGQGTSQTFDASTSSIGIQWQRYFI